MSDIYFKRYDFLGCTITKASPYWTEQVDSGLRTPQGLADYWNDAIVDKSIRYELVDAETDCQITLWTKFGSNFAPR